MSGKGSKQRPMKVDRETFEQNWDLIFGDKEKESKSKETVDTQEQVKQNS